MLKRITEKLNGVNREYLIFILAIIFMGIGQSVDGSTLSNFLKEKLDFAIMQRTALELPRELPGFLVFIVIGLLSSLGDIRIAAIANVLAASGMLLLGVVPTSNYTIIVMISFVYSCGQHLAMPVSNSIGMNFANGVNLGRKLGQINAANTASLVISSAILWLLFKYVEIDYSVSFCIGAVAFFISAILIFTMNPRQTTRSKNRFVFRKEYRLYYILSVMYGARKQIFMTFAPWALVDIFKQKVTTMTILLFIISALGIFMKPIIGNLIDRLGERVILTSEAGLLIVVCLIYAFAADIFITDIAVLIMCACYIIDQTVSSVSMARATYLKKIALCDEDVSPTLSLGISLDHIVSMFIPVVAGIVWYANGTYGYRYVFIGGAVIAVANMFFCRYITTDRPSGTGSAISSDA